MCHSPTPKRTKPTSESIERRIVNVLPLMTANVSRPITSLPKRKRRSGPVGVRGTIGIRNNFRDSFEISPRSIVRSYDERLWKLTAGRSQSVFAVGKTSQRSWLSIILMGEEQRIDVRLDPETQTRCSSGPSGMATLPSSRCFATTATWQRGSTAGVPTRDTRARSKT